MTGNTATQLEQAKAETREACAKVLELRNDEIRLMAGEMTAQEMRTVQAVLRALAVKIRSSQS